jgi:N-methylhydantoinase A
MSDNGNSSARPWWVGIDVGGTFTDVIAINRLTAEILDQKVLTTKGRQENGVLAALKEVGVPLGDVGEIVHGHTSGINAVLSRQGAKTALLATAGHRDLLDIGRMDRELGEKLYDPTWVRPHQERPIVRRRDRFGVRERTGPEGESVRALDEDQVREIAAEIRERGHEAVAICFLNSYVGPQHEERAAEIMREECPGVYVQTSKLYPVTKEAERTNTVAFDAYVGPIVTDYLHRLEHDLRGAGFEGALWIMTMNGGVGSVAETSKAPVFQLVSGPVGGVAGAVHLTRVVKGGSQNLLTMDVGGTSTDVSAIRGGETPMTDLWTEEQGLTMAIPAVDVTSVGSGAGSIAHIDSLGTLRVGPESAGSEPGPACYGRGGTRPTVTDACVHLGILQPDLFAGGAIPLDAEAAERALAALGEQLGMSPLEVAAGTYRLACSDMAGSIRAISTYRGLDLREFSLLAFGAAGPMMAVQVARELEVRSVVVPQRPGGFSAFGLLTSDIRVTKARSPMKTVQAYGAKDLEADYGKLEAAARRDLVAQGVGADEIDFQREFFAMYAGQTWDNRLPLEAGELDDGRIARLEASVHEFYEGRYGFSAGELPIVLSALEVTGMARRPQLQPAPAKAATGDAKIRTTSVRLESIDSDDVPVYDRELLSVDQRIDGPAVIVESYATSVIDGDSSARILASGELEITLR